MKKTVVLVVLIALFSGCKKNKKIVMPVTYPSNCASPVINPPVDCNQQIPADEEIKEFELQEKENPLNTLSEKESDNQEDLTTDENHELMDQERYANSSKHGLKVIYYDFNDPKIRKDQVNIIDNNLSIAKDLARKGYEIVVEGHACNSAGSRDYNMHLSESRAQGIADYFVKNGFNRNRISTVGRGCEMLIVPHGTKDQQAPNRRVEIYAYPVRANKSSQYQVKN